MGSAESHGTFARGLLHGQRLFSATLCDLQSMKVPVTIKTSYNMAEVPSLVDSGATDNFIHSRTVRQLRLGTSLLDKPKRLFNVDDTQCHDPSHGGSYVAEGAFYIRIRLPPCVVSGDCLASSRLWTDYLHCYRVHPMSRDWDCTSMSFPYLSMRP